MNGPKIYFTIPILGGIPITQTAASSFAVMLILCSQALYWDATCKSGPAAARC